jgi:protein-L-isoaspartate(D-aspartate) O-methyltransferase
MVARQIAARGIEAESVLEAMRTVAREAFVPPSLAEAAYDDRPQPIGHGRTVSQPYIVAAMTAAARIKPGDRVLEIGTGSGYGAAVLSRIGREVYTVERVGDLAESARQRLEHLGFANVHVLEGDGTLGWRAHAPYDAIVVTASAPLVPAALLEQLAIGGRVVMPVGRSRTAQRLVRMTRTGDDDYETDYLEAVTFVPVIGAQGRPVRDPAVPLVEER